MSFFKVLPFLFGIACIDNIDKAGKRDVSTGSDSPTQGNWQFTGEASWSVDTCNMAEQMDFDSADPMVLSLTDSGFTIDEALDCTMSGSDFTCTGDDLNVSSDMSENGMDAILDMNQQISGRFDNSTSMLFVASLAYVCEGPDCDALNQMMEELVFPCESLWSINLEYVGETDD